MFDVSKTKWHWATPLVPQKRKRATKVPWRGGLNTVPVLMNPKPAVVCPVLVDVCVAKALTDRPSLKMTVTGAADPQSERVAFQQAALDARLLAERRKELARGGATAEAVDATTTVAGEDRLRVLKEVYRQTSLPDKPRNLIGMAKDIAPAEMERLLKTRLLPSVDAMRELALQRGLAVRDALIARGLPSERLFIAAPKLRASGEEDAAWKPTVQLTLSAN